MRRRSSPSCRKRARCHSWCTASDWPWRTRGCRCRKRHGTAPGAGQSVGAGSRRCRRSCARSRRRPSVLVVVALLARVQDTVAYRADCTSRFCTLIPWTAARAVERLYRRPRRRRASRCTRNFLAGRCGPAIGLRRDAAEVAAGGCSRSCCPRRRRRRSRPRLFHAVVADRRLADAVAAVLRRAAGTGCCPPSSRASSSIGASRRCRCSSDTARNSSASCRSRLTQPQLAVAVAAAVPVDEIARRRTLRVIRRRRRRRCSLARIARLCRRCRRRSSFPPWAARSARRGAQARARLRAVTGVVVAAIRVAVSARDTVASDRRSCTRCPWSADRNLRRDPRVRCRTRGRRRLLPESLPPSFGCAVFSAVSVRARRRAASPAPASATARAARAHRRSRPPS